MRKFEKISFSQWQKDINDDRVAYDNLKIPERQTKYSVGYDFVSPIPFVLHPGEVKKIPTGIKIAMENDDAFFIVVRSSIGFKYNVRMTNQIGVFESDYYNNCTNEGHAWVSLQNHGQQDFIVKAGDRLVQGIFTKYLTVDNEENILKTRTGGFGSTNEEVKNGK